MLASLRVGGEPVHSVLWVGASGVCERGESAITSVFLDPKTSLKVPADAWQAPEKPAEFVRADAFLKAAPRCPSPDLIGECEVGTTKLDVESLGAEMWVDEHTLYERAATYDRLGHPRR